MKRSIALAAALLASTAPAMVLALVTMPASAVDNFAWRCGETLVIASVSQKTIKVAVSGPKKADDVVTVTSDPLGAFLNGNACKPVRDE